MSKLYDAPQRAFQDAFDTRRIADAAEQIIVHSEIADNEKGFIESRDMFFLATVDKRGFPTCSYKGGDPGFVRVVDKGTIAFPSYDGNGMFYSMGNIRAHDKIGMLFIDFETPHRMRLHGTATIDENDPLIMEFTGADMVVRVKVEELFINCPRYVHRYTKVKPSQYVPRAECETPFAVWKRIDAIQPALAAKDQGKAEAAGGLITMDEYFEKVGKGEA
ncbi:MAG TPA: pyridoxamine 5'-phosphate oxidase family protein [Burkholderiales bacterium]|nr:pyridoxamine 5'-phosphate oxidase family protein [Burkholderiales bacterium]